MGAAHDWLGSFNFRLLTKVSAFDTNTASALFEYKETRLHCCTSSSELD